MAWSPLVELVTLDQAKQHLKLSLDADSEDDDLQLKLFVAHELVIDYLTQRVSDADAWSATVSAWTAETAPKRVLAAILVQFAHLYTFRGDDGPNEVGGRWKAEVQGDIGAISPDVIMLLYRFRDPAIG
jgi:hypothetical protein